MAERPIVAIDTTPLVTMRTGIGHSVEGMWSALRAMPAGPVLIPYVLGLRPPSQRPGTSHTPGTSQAPVNIRFPTRLLLATWSRTRWPNIDRWLEGADVIHATNFVTPPSRIPTVVTVHDIGFVIDPATANRVVGRFEPILRRAISRGAHLHVTTQHVASEIEEHFGAGLVAQGRVHVVPFGVPPLGDAGPLPPGIEAAIAGREYILAIGTAERRKNLPRLVAAFGKLAGERPAIALVLAGPPGPDSPAVEAAVAALPPPVSARVLLVGAVGQGARRTLLEGATVLAYPSLYEGFGFPPLEAMQCGVPVVASNRGAVREVAGPAAQLIEPTDVDDLAAGLQLLIDDPAARQSLVERGKSHVSGFTWDRTAAGLMQVYRALAASR